MSFVSVSLLFALNCNSYYTDASVDINTLILCNGKMLDGVNVFECMVLLIYVGHYLR